MALCVPVMQCQWTIVPTLTRFGGSGQIFNIYLMLLQSNNKGSFSSEIGHACLS